MRALDDLVRSGKVLTVAISAAPAWIVSQCNTIADLRGWSPFVALQIEYSLVERTVERELIPMAESFGLALTPWSPLGGGLLTGKYRKGQSPKEGRQREVTEAQLDIAEGLVEVAGKINATPAQTAIAWLLQREIKVPNIPIVGARKPEQLEDTLKAIEVSIPDEDLQKLDQLSAVPLGFPHEFVRWPQAQQFMFGPFLPRIDDHLGRLPPANE
jgi:aryl-alcohol dehydrogenase-like predicted oxidoreductase